MLEDDFSWREFDVDLREFFFTTEDFFLVEALGMMEITPPCIGKADEKTNRCTAVSYYTFVHLPIRGSFFLASHDTLRGAREASERKIL